MKKVIAIVALAFPPVAFAQGPQKAPNIPISTGWVVGLFCSVLVWMFWGLLVFGIAMFLVGGYTYAISNGDPEKISKATKTLTYAAIAIAVAIVAKGIPILVGSFLDVPASQLNACG